MEIRLATSLGRIAARKVNARGKQAVRVMKSPSARAEGWSSIHGPANVWAESLEISERRVGPAFMGRLMSGPFPLEALGLVLAGQGCWAWAQGTHSDDVCFLSFC